VVTYAPLGGEGNAKRDRERKFVRLWGFPIERERKKALVGYRFERRRNRRIEVSRVFSRGKKQNNLYISPFKIDYFIL
jgi:hypothetical protein